MAKVLKKLKKLLKGKTAKPAKKVAKKAAPVLKAKAKAPKVKAAPVPPKKEAAKKAAAPKKTDEQKKVEIIAQLAQRQQEEAEVVLTNADGQKYCRSPDCDLVGTTDGYCRLHYLALWKRNKIKAKILEGGKLDKYIEELTSRYPDKYLEMLRKDLSSEKDFSVIISEMDNEDQNDEAENDEEAGRFIEEVRGGIPTGDEDDGF